jgi:hypothetical protein
LHLIHLSDLHVLHQTTAYGHRPIPVAERLARARAQMARAPSRAQCGCAWPITSCAAASSQTTRHPLAQYAPDITRGRSGRLGGHGPLCWRGRLGLRAVCRHVRRRLLSASRRARRIALVALDVEVGGALVDRAGPDDARGEHRVDRKESLLQLAAIVVIEALHVDHVVRDAITRRVELRASGPSGARRRGGEAASGTGRTWSTAAARVPRLITKVFWVDPHSGSVSGESFESLARGIGAGAGGARRRRAPAARC